MKIKDLLAQEVKLDRVHDEISTILKKYKLDASDALISLYILLENIHKNIKEKGIKTEVDPLSVLEMHNNHIQELTAKKIDVKKVNYIG